MLEKLFGSKARVKILKLFLSKPEEKYYIRQIARDLKLQLNSARRELDNLESFGLLTSNLPGPEGVVFEEFDRNKFLAEALNDKQKIKNVQKEGKKKPKQEKKYYQANSNFVLFEEIKALIIKAQLLYEKDFVINIQKAGKIKLLILTGFFVNNQKSSVDLLIVGSLNKNKLVKIIKELENDLGRELNYTVLTNNEFKYRRDITDMFLYEILDGKKIAIINELDIA